MSTAPYRSLSIRVGIGVLVIAAVWTVVLLHWRATNRMPSGGDVVLYLVAGPVVILLGCWIAYKAIQTLKRRRARDEANDSTAASAANPPAADGDDVTLEWKLAVLAADAWLAAGDTPEAIAAAARSGQLPDLHETLQDRQQRPVFAAEVGGIDVRAIVDTLPTRLQDWPVARQRALALAAQLAVRVLDAHFDALHAAPATAQTMPQPTNPTVTLEWLLPGEWSSTDRETARDWLVDQLAWQGFERPALEVEAHAASGVASAWKRLDELNRAANQSGLGEPRLLLAGASYLDQEQASAWDAAYRLYSADEPEGSVPGEGAAAVLVAPSSASTSTTIPTAVIAELGRLFSAPRAKPVDQPQRLQSDTLQELTLQARQYESAGGDKPIALVSDTDLRSSRGTEALHFAEVLQPDEDPTQSLMRLGVANGECGAALGLAIIAVAARHCVNEKQACLMFSHNDPQLRAVMMVSPPQPRTAAAPSLGA